ncbi:MAG: hypothetical protein ACRDAS_00925 [Cetobacterium sp.]
MKIVDFKFANKIAYAVLESNKGTKFKVKFGLDGVAGERDYPKEALDFLKEFLTSKEVLEFAYSWERRLDEKVLWLGRVIHKSLYELETGQRYLNGSNVCYFKKKMGIGWV